MITLGSLRYIYRIFWSGSVLRKSLVSLSVRGEARERGEGRRTDQSSKARLNQGLCESLT